MTNLTAPTTSRRASPTYTGMRQELLGAGHVPSCWDGVNLYKSDISRLTSSYFLPPLLMRSLAEERRCATKNDINGERLDYNTICYSREQACSEHTITMTTTREEPDATRPDPVSPDTTFAKTPSTSSWSTMENLSVSPSEAHLGLCRLSTSLARAPQQASRFVHRRYARGPMNPRTDLLPRRKLRIPC